MTNSNDKGSDPQQSDLSLPQFCNPQQQAARASEVTAACGDYEFDQSWAGYPPSIKKIPKREASLGDKAEVDSGFFEGMEASKAGQWLRYLSFEANPLNKKPPFSQYRALYKSTALPVIAKDDQWQQDAVFALQRLNGMFPWFIERVGNLATFSRSFPINEDSIRNLLPPNTTLASLADSGRLYFVSQASLDGAKAAHGHVMTAPTTLFFVSDLGQLIPLGVQLYPTPSLTNPIFTPNDDPNTWLAIKIHASCADTLVYSLYYHAVLIHFVMSNVWTAANRTLPPEHPIYAFLKPHFWMTLYVTNQVKTSMDSSRGAQLEVLGIDLSGQNLMVSRLHEDFDFRNYKPAFDFSRRGVDDQTILPNYFFRDDSLSLWAVDYDYVESMMSLFYTGDSDVLNDFELQAWMTELASKAGAGITGLPTDTDGRIVSREALYELLTSILFTVTSKHSSIINSALQYGYVAANPSIYRLAAPQKSSAVLDLATVSESLPPISEAINGRDLIAAAAHFVPVKINALGHYPIGFTNGWPTGAEENVDAWLKALGRVETAIEARNQRLDFPYTAMNPENTFNSIFN